MGLKKTLINISILFLLSSCMFALKIVYGVFRNDDCIQQSTKSGYKHHNNQKTCQKTKNKIFQHYDVSNGDVHSGHYINKWETHVELTHVLNPC